MFNALQNTMLTVTRTEIETRLIKNLADQEVLQAKITEMKPKLLELRGTLAMEEYKYNAVMREYNLAESSFQAFQSRHKEALLNAAADLGKASIVISSPASPPNVPAGPNKTLNVAIALVLGLMVGVFVIFFKEYWETSSTEKSINI